MMKKAAVLILAMFSLLAHEARGASNFDSFNDAIHKNDLQQAKAILDHWGANRENDPQYYICLFNYHFNKSRDEGIGIQKNPPREEKTIELTDPKTNKTVGYIAPVVHYDADEAQKGVTYLKQGITRFPDHYEMRFGLLYAYKELSRFDDYLAELESGLRYYRNHHPKKVYWNNNEVIGNPAEFIIETAQGNLSALMEDEGFRNERFEHRYCDLLIRYFPSHKYGYSDKGVVYYRHGDFKHALQYFQQAYKLDPEDELVAFNLGVLYKEMHDGKKARTYFQRVIELGKDEGAVQGAREQLQSFGDR